MVVATQTIEAGADLDFDALITECASLDALRQRFGRLDRRGEVTEARGKAPAVVLARSDQASDSADDPVYGDALAETWTRLGQIGDDLDFGVAGFPLLEPAELRPCLAGRPKAPVLMPVHVESWAQTSPVPEPDPDVSLWLHGTEATTPELNVVWRTEADEIEDPERLSAALGACPPRSDEILALPVPAAKAWLRDGREADVVDAVGVMAGEASRGHGDPPASRCMVWTGDGIEVKVASQLAAGDTVVLPSKHGGLSGNNWDPASLEPVRDLGDHAQLARARANRGRATLRLWPQALRDIGCPPEWLEEKLPQVVEDVDLREEVETWLAERTADHPLPADDRTSFATLARSANKQFRVLNHTEGMITLELRGLGRAEANTEGEDGSFLGSAEITLARHSDDVRTWAERFTDHLALPDEIAADVRLAAYLHDIGKSDPRFQMWLCGGSEVRLAVQSEPLAKSRLAAGDRRQREAARARSQYPRRERHELLSAHMLAGHPTALAAAADRDLVLHLVASHHGHCRPFAPPVDSEDERPVSLELGEYAFQSSTRHQAARLDSGVADRFWRLVDTYGPWGLAWLETIVRLADHRASEEEEQAQ